MVDRVKNPKFMGKDQDSVKRLNIRVDVIDFLMSSFFRHLYISSSGFKDAVLFSLKLRFVETS